MQTEIVVAVLAFLGTLLGSGAGVKLILYRIDQLEIKVNKHNQLVDRMYEQEKKTGVLEEKIIVANHRIDDLEAQHI